MVRNRSPSVQVGCGRRVDRKTGGLKLGVVKGVCGLVVADRT